MGRNVKSGPGAQLVEPRISATKVVSSTPASTHVDKKRILSI